uniref:NADH-ubiquinone oxidoreductase chain 6 n=1 Tax=Staurois latopalmatus TaxID=240406 RepID=D7UPX7_9NEOB|nr:NADH dehydrogenase subunit 6 [Staurois latopalmatus]
MVMEFCLLAGLLAVASNPSPYYAALGLVGGAGAGCLVLANGGMSFLCLVLFLVYLGGMMVVFAYCSALVAEPYPEAWGSRVVVSYLSIYNFLVFSWLYWGEDLSILAGGLKCGVTCEEWMGVGNLLGGGGLILLLGGLALLLCLLLVLEVVRGYKGGGALRAV